ncbi:hypothetical protein [Thermococcus alcaliphilus]|uniref:hypothetical protein n=1 Tax=Thermococcus alcaliphilus TaxID=139207 RepID=UPI002090C709|nr:hypothetical protein [Thermococcus alcaliphilus]MCO6041700.1 hypothetical protein [Thermococcus alcaliphilus]
MKEIRKVINLGDLKVVKSFNYLDMGSMVLVGPKLAASIKSTHFEKAQSMKLKEEIFRHLNGESCRVLVMAGKISPYTYALEMAKDYFMEVILKNGSYSILLGLQKRRANNLEDTLLEAFPLKILEKVFNWELKSIEVSTEKIRIFGNDVVSKEKKVDLTLEPGIWLIGLSDVFKDYVTYFSP